MRRLTAVLLLVTAVAGCKDDTVRVTFRPEVGAVYRYEVTVRSRSEVRIPGEGPQVHDEEITLQSKQTVLEAGPDGVRVQVVLGDASGSVRTFAVLFDRVAQLESVESDDAIADAEAGVIGLSEIFPAAAGAPPDRRLGPGERWEIDDDVLLPGSVGSAQLTGDGRLVELAMHGHAKVARLATSSRLQLSTVRQTAEGDVVRLEGEQVTKQRASHDLGDGAVWSASSRTSSTFALEISPPFGELREPVRGTLTVTVTSKTRRLE